MLSKKIDFKDTNLDHQVIIICKDNSSYKCKLHLVYICNSHL